MLVRGLILVLVVFACNSCKQDKKISTTSQQAAEEKFKSKDLEGLDSSKLKPAYIATNSNEPSLEQPSSEYKESVDPSNEEMRSHAETILKLRKAKNIKIPAIIESGKWIFDGENINGKFTDVKILNGKWIDFTNKWTYTYGDSSGQAGSGIYHFDPSTEVLIMLDNDKTKKPNEYKIKFASDAMVLMGQITYADGNYQAKCTRFKF